MSKIELETLINSKLEVCFDLSRSIDLHKISTAHTKEEAIAGTTSGLIDLNETVTWRAIHFGISQTLTSKIVAFDRPNHFRDIQIKGAFKYFTHDHTFEMQADQVLMRDIFIFESPIGILGSFVDKFVLKDYLTRLLIQRNNMIKRVC